MGFACMAASQPSHRDLQAQPRRRAMPKSSKPQEKPASKNIGGDDQPRRHPPPLRKSTGAVNELILVARKLW